MNTAAPRVTLVITQRERMALTERSLESILSDQSEPFDLIYVSAGSPDHVNAYLERRQKEAGFKLMQYPTWMWPNIARNIACAGIETPYVVFMDNDVLIEPGWLKKLVACAEETNAALVGPLYLWSDGAAEPKVHMAGGSMYLSDSAQGTTLHERHVDINAPLAHRATLHRKQCDFLEYHCMLVRTEFLRSTGGLSEDIVCVHEHIDIALTAKQSGQTIWMEPSAAVTYLAFIPYQLAETAFYKWRWSEEAAEASINAFGKKWGLIDHADAYSGVRKFIQNHLSAIELFLPGMPCERPVSSLLAHDIKQNLYGLLTQAAANGYDSAALESFSQAYTAAMSMFGAGFRPCARPFVAHCTGTASALVAFGFAPHLVVAGMLHAAYSHTPVGSQPQALEAMDNLAQQLQSIFGKRVERLIAAYARYQVNAQAWCNAHPLATMTTEEAEVVTIAIANSIDECAAGEQLFSKKPGPTAAWLSYAQVFANAMQVPALAQTLANLAQSKPPEGFAISRPVGESYYLKDGHLISMAHQVFVAWDERNKSSIQAEDN